MLPKRKTIVEMDIDYRLLQREFAPIITKLEIFSKLVLEEYKHHHPDFKPKKTSWYHIIPILHDIHFFSFAKGAGKDERSIQEITLFGLWEELQNEFKDKYGFELVIAKIGSQQYTIRVVTQLPKKFRKLGHSKSQVIVSSE